MLRNGRRYDNLRRQKLHSAKLKGYNDHRIVMAFSVAAMNIGDCEIDDAQSINKSYPSFLMILIILEVRLMSSEFGNKIKLSIFGESHGEAIGCVIDSIPAGVKAIWKNIF